MCLNGTFLRLQARASSSRITGELFLVIGHPKWEFRGGGIKVLGSKSNLSERTEHLSEAQPNRLMRWQQMDCGLGSQ